MIVAARGAMDADAWDHLVGGAGAEVTVRRNRAAFERLGLRPRLLQAPDPPGVSTTFLGQVLDLPVMLAPVGSIARYHPDGAVGCAQAADRAGTLAFVSCFALPELEQVRAAISGAVVAQLYLRGKINDVLAQAKRAEALGCLGLCLTADLAAAGRRERRPVAPPASPGARPHNQPGLDTLFHGTNPFSWRDVESLRAATRLPLILKGVTGAADARVAVECGTEVVYLSNHGGRFIDHVPSTIELLPEVVAAVSDETPVIVDSGFVHGTDIVKAIALGARAVLIGRLSVWALAAGGVPALVRVLDLLAQEVADTMAHLGAPTLHELNRTMICTTFAPRPSGWIGFASGEAPHE